MMVVGSGLRELCQQHGLTSDAAGIDEFSVSLRLGTSAFRFREGESPLSVAHNLRADATEEIDLRQSPLLIESGRGVLACSAERITIPVGYFGLVQTKGTLARFLVQTTCCDGQVEPGYSGRVTFEIVNFNTRAIEIPAGTQVAQMFLFCTVPKNSPTYNGRYQGAEGPTLPQPLTR